MMKKWKKSLLAAGILASIHEPDESFDDRKAGDKIV